MRAEIYLEARRWVGTPYHHHGRKRGQSCDCIGLLIGVGRALGLKTPADREIPAYSPLPHDNLSERMAVKFLVPSPAKSIDEVLPGQIGLFGVSVRDVGQHFCIFGLFKGRKTMIHSYMRGRTVIETGISDHWRDRFIAAADYPGVTS